MIAARNVYLNDILLSGKLTLIQRYKKPKFKFSINWKYEGIVCPAHFTN